MEDRIDEFTAKSNVDLYSTFIASAFDTLKLDPFTIQYLVSGLFLLHNNDSSVDFSPVILQYGRAVENELKEKLFKPIHPTKDWMLGRMQGPLEQLKSGTTSMPMCTPAELAILSTELGNRFVYPMNLEIELLQNIRESRNDAGHSGQIRTKAEAEIYIVLVNNFLNKWISELK